jgi:polyisoprenoid-binding protein YceI
LIEGTVEVSSIITFDETRDTHLQSPDFFDVARHPEIHFASASVETDGDKLVVRGDLTIKGITKPVELRGSFLGTGTDPMGSERIALELSGRFDRTDFGLNWNLPLPSGGFLLPNEVVIKASFAAVKAG